MPRSRRMRQIRPQGRRALPNKRSGAATSLLILECDAAKLPAQPRSFGVVLESAVRVFAPRARTVRLQAETVSALLADLGRLKIEVGRFSNDGHRCTQQRIRSGAYGRRCGVLESAGRVARSLLSTHSGSRRVRGRAMGCCQASLRGHSYTQGALCVAGAGQRPAGGMREPLDSIPPERWPVEGRGPD